MCFFNTVCALGYFYKFNYRDDDDDDDDGGTCLVSGTLTRCLESLEGQTDSPEEAKTTDALKQVTVQPSTLLLLSALTLVICDPA